MHMVSRFRQFCRAVPVAVALVVPVAAQIPATPSTQPAGTPTTAPDGTPATPSTQPAGTPTTAPDGTTLTPGAPAASASATGLCEISGPVLSPADFNVEAGQPVADVTTTMLPDGRIRIYAFAQNQGIRSAVSVAPDGLSFVPEAGARLPDGAGMPRIVGDPIGGYRLFFISGDGIQSALSADGLTFAAEAGFRITKEAAGFTDATGVLQPLSGTSLVAVPTGGYRMYFSDLPRPGDTPGGHRVKSAVSPDMVNWVVEPGVRVGEGAPVLTDSAEHPFVLPHPDGSVTLYFAKFGPTAGGVEGVYQSTSTDGLTFTTEELAVYGGNDPDLIRRADGTLLMYYGGFDPIIGGTVSVAACPDPAAPPAIDPAAEPSVAPAITPMRVGAARR